MGKSLNAEQAACLFINLNLSPKAVAPLHVADRKDVQPKRLTTVHALINHRTGQIYYVGIGGTPEQACAVIESLEGGSPEVEYCRAAMIYPDQHGYIVYYASKFAPPGEVGGLLHISAMARVVRHVGKAVRGDLQHRNESDLVTALQRVGLFVRVSTPA